MTDRFKRVNKEGPIVEKGYNYYSTVVDLIMKNDVRTETISMRKHSTYHVYLYKLFDINCVHKMSFFNVQNWYDIERRISSKYGIEDKSALKFIKVKLQTLFGENE